MATFEKTATTTDNKLLINSIATPFCAFYDMVETTQQLI